MSESRYPSLLNVLRNRAGLTQGQLGKQAGVSQSVVSFIENDTQTVLPSAEEAVAKVLGFSGALSDLRMPYEDYLRKGLDDEGSVIDDPETSLTTHHALPTRAPLLALIAHDGKKDAMLAFAQRHREMLSRYRLIGTGTTGALVAGATELHVERMRSGPKGGDVQIAARIMEEPFAAVIFFVEPMDVHPHDPDIQTLLRTCNLSNVPLATNEATAHLLMLALDH